MNRIPPGMLAVAALVAAVRFLSYAVQSRVAATPHDAIPLLSLAFALLATVGYILFRLGRWLDTGPDNDARIYTISFLMAAVILTSWSVRIMVDPYFPHPEAEHSIINQLR